MSVCTYMSEWMDGWLDGWMMKGRKFNSEHKYVCEYNQHTFCSGDKDQIERKRKKRKFPSYIAVCVCNTQHKKKKDENKI